MVGGDGRVDCRLQTCTSDGSCAGLGSWLGDFVFSVAFVIVDLNTSTLVLISPTHTFVLLS